MPDQADGTYGNGRYRLLRPLGAGGMGQVILTYDVYLDRPVALKVLRPDVVGDPERRRRFATEARVMGKLHHAGAVTILTSSRQTTKFALWWSISRKRGGR